MNEIVEVLLEQLKNGNNGIYIMIGTILGGILGSLVSVVGSVVTNWFNQKNELSKIKLEYEEQREIENTKRLESKLEHLSKILVELDYEIVAVIKYSNQE